MPRTWNAKMYLGWRTPKQIFNAHPLDQCPQIRTDLRPASQIPRFPAPVAAKTGTMPAHQGLWPNDLDGLEDRWKPTIQRDEEQAIVVVNWTRPRTLRCSTIS